VTPSQERLARCHELLVDEGPQDRIHDPDQPQGAVRRAAAGACPADQSDSTGSTTVVAQASRTLLRRTGMMIEESSR